MLLPCTLSEVITPIIPQTRNEDFMKKHFGLSLKISFETQFLKVVVPNFYWHFCGEFGFCRLDITWLGFEIQVGFWAGEV